MTFSPFNHYNSPRLGFSEGCAMEAWFTYNILTWSRTCVHRINNFTLSKRNVIFQVQMDFFWIVTQRNSLLLLIINTKKGKQMNYCAYPRWTLLEDCTMIHSLMLGLENMSQVEMYVPVSFHPFCMKIQLKMLYWSHPKKYCTG